MAFRVTVLAESCAAGAFDFAKVFVRSWFAVVLAAALLVVAIPTGLGLHATLSGVWIGPANAHENMAIDEDHQVDVAPGDATGDAPEGTAPVAPEPPEPPE